VLQYLCAFAPCLPQASHKIVPFLHRTTALNIRLETQQLPQKLLKIWPEEKLRIHCVLARISAGLEWSGCRKFQARFWPQCRAIGFIKGKKGVGYVQPLFVFFPSILL
jgi:hypothetical protein